MALNEQNPGIEWTHPYGRRGYTWNPVAGCQHGCRWTMPDGKTAICYAEAVAERSIHYPVGFKHHYWKPDRLEDPQRLKEPSGIFLDSMSDLMGAWVEDTQIEQVLQVCEDTPQHIYFLLTKNAPRLLKFAFPANVWVGVSSPPDEMFGKRLSQRAKDQMLNRSLEVLKRVHGGIRWMSFEPLSWDVSPIVQRHALALSWAVIGAASNGKKEYPPEHDHLLKLLSVLNQWQLPVFYKGNLRSLPYAATNWREEFPGQEVFILPVEPAPVEQQMRLW